MLARTLAVAVTLFAVAGCGYDSYSTGKPLKSPVALAGKRVDVAVPADGKDVKSAVQTGSGQQVANLLRRVAEERGGAKSGAAAIRVEPTIVEWTDRAFAAGFNKPDTIKLKLRVVEVGGGRVIDERTITARADPENYRQLKPDDLLLPLLQEWADAIFGKVAAAPK